MLCDQCAHKWHHECPEARLGMEESQREINDTEWRNPDNWAGVWPFRADFSKRDSRASVPHYFNGSIFAQVVSPRIMNLGHRWGFPLFVLFNALATIMFGLIGYLVDRQ